MSKGMFIAFEGGEGCGKSTQSRMMAEALERYGLSVELTREPGGTPGAEAIRELLLNPPGKGWGMQAEAMLFAAARSDHVSARICPALRDGRWVICDRFVDSSRAYQGRAGALGDDAITRLHQIGSDGLRPDLTLVLDVPEQLLAERLAARDGGVSDAIGGRCSAYHSAVAQAFRDFAAHDDQQIVLIDGGGTPADVHAQVVSVVAEHTGYKL